MLAGYRLKNMYIDNSVEKWVILMVLGCLEHTGVVTQLFKEAQKNKGNLVLLWLDLTNIGWTTKAVIVWESLQGL